jgi:hypothetical protein
MTADRFTTESDLPGAHTPPPASASTAQSPPGHPSPVRMTPWMRWALPSFTDIFFLVFVVLLSLTADSKVLLTDADTGWHIRNGEMILASHRVPHTDPFSYTMAGKPWFAWEWLYDVGIAAIHHFAGLNGVVLFSAVVIAATFALLFRFLLRRSGDFVVATLLTLLAAAAAQVHMLARPHLMSWLFTLLWIEVLFRFEEGRRRSLLWLPPLMLLWVNLHGGFLLGLVLLGLFLCSALWRWMRSPGSESLRPVLQLGAIFPVCLGVTLLTPYGYMLYVHIYHYLSNGFLMNSINEFMSPNFHGSAYRYFEALILLSLPAVAWGRRKLTETDLLLLLLAIHSALFAARNIPLAAIMIGYATARPWAEALSSRRRHRRSPRWVGSLLELVQGISENMSAMERQLRGHALVLAFGVALVAIALHGGRLFSARLMSAHFDAQKFPVKAAEYIAARDIHEGIFEPDSWSGYLIYRLYPRTRFYFDDRHDFYGEAFVRDFLKISRANWEWSGLLKKYHVRWVLIPPRMPLASVLKESPEWRLDYDDGTALLFSRRSP